MTTESTAATKPINQLVNHALELCEQFNARSDPDRMQALAEAKRILFTRIPAEPGFAEFRQKKSEFYSTYASLCEYQQRHESAILEERFQKLRPARPVALPERNSSLGARARGPRPLVTATSSTLPYPTSPTERRAAGRPAGHNGALANGGAATHVYKGAGYGDRAVDSALDANPALASTAAAGASHGAPNGSAAASAHGPARSLRDPSTLLRPSNGQQNGYPRDSSQQLKMPEPRRSESPRRPVSPIKTARPEDYEISPAILRNKITVSNVLVLDVRQRSAFEDQHIQAPLVACLDPTYLTSHMSITDLDDTFVLAPTEEAANFALRDRVDMIVLYDERSQHISQSPVLQNVTNTFVDAGKRPYLLRGGIEAWTMSGNSVTALADPAREPGRGSDLSSTGGSTTSTNAGSSEAVNALPLPPPPSKPPPPIPPPHHLYRPQDRRHDQPPPPGTVRMPSLPPAVPALQPRALASSPPTFSMASSSGHASSHASGSAPPEDRGSERSGSPSSITTSSTATTPATTAAPATAATATRPFVHTPEDLARQFGGYADERPRTGLKSLRVPKMHAHAGRDLSVSPSVSPVRTLAQLSRSGSKSGKGSSGFGSGGHSRTGTPAASVVPAAPAGTVVVRQPLPSYPPGILKTTGLKNLGNSCYMNCVIQCMLSVPSFVLPFYDGSFAQYINYRSRLGYQGALAAEFAGLVRAMLEPNSRYIAPVGMKQLAARLRPDDFGGYEQQDCQEFLTFVLDGLHEDLNANGDKARDGELDAQEEQRREQLGIRVASAIEWERYLKGDTSLIVDLFQGQYLSRLQCTVCRNTSTTYNAFSSLSLPLVSPKFLEQHTTLRACFDEFVKPEILDGDNAWHCPHCRRKQRAIKTLRISRLPPILIIHLKRFKRSMTGAVNKLETPVDYPLRGLDLTRYWPQLSQGEHSQREAQLLAALPPRGQTPPFVYDLRAVTLHQGTLEGGHYTAVAQKPGRGWFYFDDANVSPVKEQAAVSKNAYVLFYTRQVDV